MFNIKFKDNQNNIFTYTTYSAKDEEEAKHLWEVYVEKHFNCFTEIIDIKRII